MTIVAWLMSVVAALLALPVLILAVEAAAAFLSRSRDRATDAAKPDGVRFAILVPAHNEEAGIRATLDNLRGELTPGSRLLVVADNCSDGTAAAARAAGAEVIERHDLSRRGKGYALDFGRSYLASDPPQVVIFVDADCQVTHGLPAVLAGLANAFGRPVQAKYDLSIPDNPSTAERVAAFAWIVKTHIRPLGLKGLGLPCQLMGTGMAVPWGALERVELASAHLVEDVKLGLDLAALGAAPLYHPTVRVVSEQPPSARGAHVQRQRWETGSLQVLAQTAPRMLLRSVSTGNIRLLAMAVDLLVPPLMLLILLESLGLLAFGSTWLLGGPPLPASIVCTSLIVLAAVLLACWLGYARHTLRLTDILLLPVLIFRKVAFYAGAWRNRGSGWVRTDRQ